MHLSHIRKARKAHENCVGRYCFAQSLKQFGRIMKNEEYVIIALACTCVSLVVVIVRMKRSQNFLYKRRVFSKPTVKVY